MAERQAAACTAAAALRPLRRAQHVQSRPPGSRAAHLRLEAPSRSQITRGSRLLFAYSQSTYLLCAGAPRTFEFQLMPQLLCSLEAEEGDLEALVAAAKAEAAGGASPESLDWGTVAVYTCSASCEAASGASCVYSDEFVWHQPVV